MKRHLTPAAARHPLIPDGSRLTVRDLSADQMAEAVVRAARATGETHLLVARAEAALKGDLPLRARWVALAVLLALHHETEIQPLAEPLGCGFSPLRVLAAARGKSGWDEAVVGRIFKDLAGDDEATPLTDFEAELKAVARGVLQRRIDCWAGRNRITGG